MFPPRKVCPPLLLPPPSYHLLLLPYVTQKKKTFFVDNIRSGTTLVNFEVRLFSLQILSATKSKGKLIIMLKIFVVLFIIFYTCEATCSSSDCTSCADETTCTSQSGCEYDTASYMCLQSSVFQQDFTVI